MCSVTCSFLIPQGLSFSGEKKKSQEFQQLLETANILSVRFPYYWSDSDYNRFDTTHYRSYVMGLHVYTKLHNLFVDRYFKVRVLAGICFFKFVRYVYNGIIIT